MTGKDNLDMPGDVDNESDEDGKAREEDESF